MKGKRILALCLVCLLLFQTNVFASVIDLQTVEGGIVSTNADNVLISPNLMVSGVVELTTSYKLLFHEDNKIKANVKITNNSYPNTLYYKIVDCKGKNHDGFVSPDTTVTVPGIPAGGYDVYLKGSAAGFYKIIITDWP